MVGEDNHQGAGVEGKDSNASVESRSDDLLDHT